MLIINVSSSAIHIVAKSKNVDFPLVFPLFLDSDPKPCAEVSISRIHFVLMSKKSRVTHVENRCFQLGNTYRIQEQIKPRVIHVVNRWLHFEKHMSVHGGMHDLLMGTSS